MAAGTLYPHSQPGNRLPRPAVTFWFGYDQVTVRIRSGYNSDWIRIIHGYDQDLIWIRSDNCQDTIRIDRIVIRIGQDMNGIRSGYESDTIRIRSGYDSDNPILPI